MTAKLTIEPVRGTVSVRNGDAVIAESRNALVLREEDHAPVYYLPREDVGMELLDRSDKVTHCPWKGDATHYHVVGLAERIPDAAWSYESPLDAAKPIAGHLAFYPGRVAIESG